MFALRRLGAAARHDDKARNFRAFFVCAVALRLASCAAMPTAPSGVLLQRQLVKVCSACSA